MWLKSRLKRHFLLKIRPNSFLYFSFSLLALLRQSVRSLNIHGETSQLVVVLTFEGLVTEAAVEAWLRPLHRVRLQVSQQLRLRAEGLLADGAAEVREAVLQTVSVSLFRRLKHFVAAAAGEAAAPQVHLLVVAEAGQVVELAVALVALVDGARAVAALVRQELGFGSEDGVTLETRVRPGGAGRGRRGLLHLSHLSHLSHGLSLRGHSSRGDAGAAGPASAQVTNHLWGGGANAQRGDDRRRRERQVRAFLPETCRCNTSHTEDTCGPPAENYGRCCAEL